MDEVDSEELVRESVRMLREWLGNNVGSAESESLLVTVESTGK